MDKFAINFEPCVCELETRTFKSDGKLVFQNRVKKINHKDNSIEYSDWDNGAVIPNWDECNIDELVGVA